MKIPHVNWVALGIIFGTFYGLLSELFNLPQLAWKTLRDIARSIFTIIFQFVFQFIGGFAGAIGVGLFLNRYSHGYFGVPELILLAISLIGISGKLSDIIYWLPGFMSEFAKKRAK